MKLVANKASYGFMGRLFAKGDEIEISDDVKYPEEHFDILEAPKEIVKPKIEHKKAHSKAK